jgi:hypothetical protein
MELPLADSQPRAECTLDLEGLGRQRERYRALGATLERVEREPLALTARFSPAVDEELLAETLAIERECCEFFRLDYDPAGRVLTARVDEERLDPALDALRYALAGS